ncbi:MAG: HlyD family efflux transporter periplasmic adaptor subunit [Planctomycetota bacterium]
MKLRRSLILAAILPVVGATLWLVFGRQMFAKKKEDYRIARIERKPFQQVVRRTGTLKPVKEQIIVGKLTGAILEIVPQGKAVEKDDILLRVDPTPHEDAKTAQDALIAQIKAEDKKQQQESAKSLNQAKEDVAGYDLRVELEQARLIELKKGPSATDAINARINLENNQNLRAAAEEELKALDELAVAGFISQEELRQKQLAVKEQQLAVINADIAQRKLYLPDLIKIAEQELQARDAIKMRDDAKERVALLERNIQRDQEAFAQRLNREQKRLKDLIENIEKTIYRAPTAGIVVHKKPRWYNYAPGRDVSDGWQIMGLPDFSAMKVALTVDEARIANVVVGLAANITPAGWTGAPFKGKVVKVADKGRDEFELYANDTTQITGTANRQVFDVEVEIEGQSDAFRPGLRAVVDIVIKTLDDAIIVPRTAILQEKDESFVQVSAPKGVERRVIKVVAENELSAVVEGVRESEAVLIVHDRY